MNGYNVKRFSKHAQQFICNFCKIDREGHHSQHQQAPAYAILAGIHEFVKLTRGVPLKKAGQKGG